MGLEDRTWKKMCANSESDQAVATSTVYLIRSMGSIYGVTITSAIVQNVLMARLPATLGDAATDEVSSGRHRYVSGGSHRG